MGGKVLFTASTYSHVVNFHLAYLERFCREGWTVHVACGGRPAAVPYAQEVIGLPLEKRMWSAGNLRAAAQLREKMAAEGYDLVVAHTTLAAFFTRLAAKGLRARPRVANMVHGYLFDDETPGLKRGVLLAAERWTAGETDLLLAMNEWDYGTAKRYKLGGTVVQVPGVGVDFSRFEGTGPDRRREMRKKWGVPEDAFVAVYAAEFSKRKSQEVIVRAMAQLPERMWLALAGDGALRGRCEGLARELGVAGRVLFPGQVEDVPGWYAMADAAVSASRSEGLPFNIMEAMYAGLPVAASDVEGRRGLIEDGGTGLLYPYGDVEGCAQRLMRLAREDGLGRELARRARDSVERFRLERVLPIVWEQYAALASQAAAV